MRVCTHCIMPVCTHCATRVCTHCSWYNALCVADTMPHMSCRCPALLSTLLAIQCLTHFTLRTLLHCHASHPAPAQYPTAPVPTQRYKTLRIQCTLLLVQESPARRELPVRRSTACCDLAKTLSLVTLFTPLVVPPATLTAVPPDT